MLTPTTIFFVTSGLNVESGMVSLPQRFEQTLASAESIRRRIPGSKIVLLEGGKYPLTLAQREKLQSVYDDVLDFTYHPTIQFAHNQNVNVMYIKGPCEALMMYEACRLITQPVDRVFKLSGRYYLTDQFDISQHQASGKYVFKTKDPGVHYYHDNKDDADSQLSNIEQYYTPFQYKTRLYSFCGTMLPLATHNYQQLFQTMINSYINHGYIDLEHSVYRVVGPELIKETPVIGVGGVQAENLKAMSE